jgi:hypothetical protein
MKNEIIRDLFYSHFAVEHKVYDESDEEKEKKETIFNFLSCKLEENDIMEFESILSEYSGEVMESAFVSGYKMAINLILGATIA